MAGQLRAAGAIVEEFTVGGKIFRARTMRLSDMLAIKTKCKLAMQADFISLACGAAEKASPELRETILRMGFDRAERQRAVGQVDLESFLDTEAGMVAILLQIVERGDGSPLADEMEACDLLQELIVAGKIEEVTLKLKLAQGGAELKNSSGRPGRSAQRQRGAADGQASTPTLPASAAGRRNK